MYPLPIGILCHPLHGPLVRRQVGIADDDKNLAGVWTRVVVAEAMRDRVVLLQESDAFAT